MPEKILKRYGLVGYPLGHSFSKAYFTAKFEKEGLDDCVFENFPLTDITQFPALLQKTPGLVGLCVTIPYKEQVLQYVDACSEAVQHIGAANCLVPAAGNIRAYNTDIIGFEESFAPYLQPHHEKALVLGTGGAAKAVEYVLRKRGIPYLLVSRKERPGEGSLTYDAISKTVMDSHTVIINCTPVGMFPNINECPPIPYEYITARHYLYDLVYRPAETLFLQKGAAQNAVTRNGYDMLVIQAEANWKIWNAE